MLAFPAPPGAINRIASRVVGPYKIGIAKHILRDRGLPITEIVAS